MSTFSKPNWARALLALRQLACRHQWRVVGVYQGKVKDVLVVRSCVRCGVATMQEHDLDEETPGVAP